MFDRQAELENRLAERDAELAQLRQEFREMKEQANKDPLTKLANRDAFVEGLQSAISVASTGAQDLSLMMIDIDHFKAVNDEHGHLVGDLALQAFSKLLLESVNTSAVAARYGGEEFAIILPSTNLQGAWKLAHTLRERLVELYDLVNDGPAPAVRITVSIGIAQYRQSETITSLIERADLELYVAKREGRDRIRPSLVP
jgi:diguanylate cyclase